ncbi:hypothetical protein [Halosimplex carlsbadense]|uniref:hypothetical protein n=1 Tax=Halosimplex carlsbadense TaxID=171164 RepID=UPI001F32B67E|nr:hypothetical protein [Halosimplex carlsbadense]
MVADHDLVGRFADFHADQRSRSSNHVPTDFVTDCTVVTDSDLVVPLDIRTFDVPLDDVFGLVDRLDPGGPYSFLER